MITVDRGGGNVFTINHTNVETVITAATVGNHGPVAEAGPDQSVSTSSTVTLTAAGSSDQDGNTLTYQWTQIEGTKVTLSSSTAASPTFTAPSSATTLQFIVVVSDGTTKHADTVTINVGAANVAPTISNLSGDSLSYSEGDGAVVIDQGANALVADSDSANFDTGTLTISIPSGNVPTEDVLSIHNQGTGAGQIGVSGSNVTYGGVVIGTYTGGAGGNNLVVTFNNHATPTAVTELVKNITYEDINVDAPIAGALTVRFSLTDGDGGTSANYDVTVNVSGVNDAPVLADTALSLTVAEDAGAPSGAVGSLLSTFTGGITDVDSGASKGIAITGTDETNGTWYYTTNGGSTWTAVGSVSNTSALLLADNASTRLYFSPGANYNGTSSAALTLRAWDQTSGTAGTKVTTASNGGTTAFSSATDTIDVTVSAVNDAPVLADTALTLTVAEDAGAPSGAVGSLLSAFTGGITDVDASAVKGLAITGTSETNGTWYYTTNGGTTWTAIGSVSNTSALLLADNGSTRLYFAPSADYNGTSSAALTLRAWDQTSGSAGTKVTTASNGGTTAFSSATDTVDVTVTAVNDAPAITGLAGDSLAYAEGAGVQWIEQGLDAAVADVDSTDFAGGTLTVSFVSGSDSTEDVLAVFNQGSAAGQIGVSGSNITYGGVTIGTFTGGSGGAALVITFNSNATPARLSTLVNLITYQNTDTDAPTTGTRTVRYVLTDGDGGTSLNHDATVTVTAVNDAPVLADTALTLTVAEDAGAPSGAVGSLLSAFTGGITDVDASAVKGIAITGTNETNGTWYYTTNGGTTWTAVGTVSNTSALLLADNGSTRLYFEPSADYNGTSSGALTLRAWDQTSGTAGTKVTTASNGGTTAFSSATDTIDVTVSAVNDAPVNTVPGAQTVAEDTPLTITGLSVTDLDGNLASTQLSVTNGTLNVSLVGGATISAGANGSGTLTLSGTEAQINSALATLAYQGMADFSGADTLTVTSTDSNAVTDIDTVSITVSPINDAPIRTAGTVSNLTVSEDAGLVSLGLGSVTYSPGGGADESGQTLTYAVTALPSGTIGDVYLADGTTLVTLSAYTLAEIQGMQFRPTANASGVTAFQFNVYDSGGTANGGANTISQFILITVTAVNDAPTITNLSGDSLSYSEGDGAVVIEQGGNALVADVDSTNLDTGTLTVSIPSGGNSAEDVLSIRNQGTGAGQIGVSGSNVTYQGVTIGTFTGGSSGSNLVITLNGSATPTAVTALVQNITYENTDTAAPTTGARTVRYVLTDGDGGSSANHDTTVTVSGVNDAPVITPIAPDVTFVEGGLAQVIDATGTVTDVDSTNFDGGVMTVSISANGTIDDRLIVGNWGTGPGQVGVSGSDVTYGGTVIGTASGGTSGSDPLVITFNTSATPSAVQEVYRSIQFNNVSDNPSTATRTLTIGLTDGDGGTATPQTKLVYVQGTNDAPVLTFGEGDKNFTEGTLAVMIDALPNVSDLDSTDFDTGTLTITISVNPSVDDRVELLNTGMGAGQIGVSGTNVYYGGTLIGTQAGGIGAVPFVVTFNANADAAIVGEVMANIRFWVAGDAPSTATRTIEAVLTDGDGGTSLTASKQITVTAVNDPTVVTGGTSGTGNEDTTLTGTLTATDAEGLTDGTVFTVSANATNGTASIDPATGLWSYTPTADFNGSDSFTVTITDDAGNTTTQVISVTVTAVADITDDTLTTNEDTVISANVLTGTNGATADSFEGTPVLTSVTQGANGSVTFLANGTVTYTPNANFNGTDSFTYTITSGGVTETATVNVTVTAVNDPTVVTGGTSGSGTEDTTITNTLTATDADGLTDGTVFTVSANATNGTASIDPATGLWSYTPTADFHGSDSFTVTITDDAGNTTVQVITLTVNPVVDITNDSVTTTEDTAISANVLTGTNGATADSFEGTPTLTSVTQGANGSVTFLANGTVTYTPNANFNGTDSFTYTITSGGVTETATVTVTVNAVNDTPTDLSLSANTVAENAANGTIIGTVTGTDPDSGDTKAYSFTDSAGGRFAINNTTGQITVANGSLFDYESTASHSVTVRVTDSGGLTYDETFTINLTDVNETPTDLNLSANTVAENAANGTVVGTISGTDPDSGDTKTYSFTDSAGGRFAINSSMGQITVADGSLLNYESATSHSVTVRVTDAGGLTYDETFTINLTNVNEAPTGADATVTLNEDTSHTLTTANFGFSDVDAGDSLSAVRIDTLPGAGSLTLSGVAVTAGQVVSVADINAGSLVFTPAADANGTGYASFTFSVRDSGTLYDLAPNALTFDVTTVNDAPVNTVPGAQTIAEDTPIAITGLNVNDVDGNLSSTQLTVTNGTLTVSLSGGATISAGTNGSGTLTLSGSQAQINAALATLTYQGTLNFTGSDTLTIASTDTNSGTDVDTVAITVTAVNDAPTDIIFDTPITLNNGSTDGYIGVTQFNYGQPPSTQLTFEMSFSATSIPSGSLELVSYALSSGTSNEINIWIDPSGDLWFRLSSGAATPLGFDARALIDGTQHQLSITWDGATGDTRFYADGSQVGADTYRVGGSVPWATGAETSMLMFGQEQDAVGSGFDSTQIFTGNIFEVRMFTDVRTAPEIAANVNTYLSNPSADPNLLANWRMVNDGSGLISDLAGNHDLTLYNTAGFNSTFSVAENASNGTRIASVVDVTDADIGDNHTFSLTNDAGGRFAIDSNTGVITVANGSLLNYESATSHTVTVRATDSGGLAYDEIITINLTNVNEAPTGTDVTVTIDEDTSQALTAANFGFSDVDAGDSFSAVRIDTLPSAGSLTLSGVAVTAGQVITVADITAGYLVFAPVADANGTGYASFTFSVRDGNNAYDAAPNTLTFTVTPINDAPIAGDDSYTVQEDAVLNVNVSSGLLATDMEIDGDVISTILVSGPSYGSLTLNADGSFSYTPNANYSGPDSFTYRVTDGTLQSNVATVSLTVTPVNDAPLLVTNTGSTVAEGGTDTIDASELAVTDVEQTSVQLTYTIGIGPASGRLELTTAPGISATTFTQDDIAANRLIYIHDGSETTSDSFTFTVNDGAGGAIGSTTVTLTITPVNDTPTITSGGGGASSSINVAENVTGVTIVTGEDVDLPAQALSYSISGGVDQALFTINAATGALSFTAPPDFEVATDANGDNMYVVQVQVVDSQGASITQTIQVTVTDVVENVAPPPVVPPILLTPTPPSPSGGPSSGPGTPPADEPATVSDPPTVSLGPTVPPMVGPPVNVVPLTLVLPSDRPVERVPEEPRKTEEDAKDRPLFFVNDDQGRPLYSVLPVEPAPTLEPEPPETTPSVSDLLMAKLDEMAVSLEQAVSQSQERHELMARVAAVTGTTLSVGFVAWALRSGAILASMLATMPAWQHFDPLPVVKLTRNERIRRRDEATRAQQEEAVEFKGLGRVLDKTPALKRTA